MLRGPYIAHWQKEVTTAFFCFARLVGLPQSSAMHSFFLPLQPAARSSLHYFVLVNNNNNTAASVRQDESSSTIIAVMTGSREGDDGVTLNEPFFSSSLSQQMILFVLLLGSLTALRVAPIAHVVNSALSLVVNDEVGDYNLVPLSTLDWIIHYPLQCVGLELVMAFHNLSHRHSHLATDHDDKKTNKENDLLRFKAMRNIFMVHFLQGWIGLMNHSLIGGINPSLEMRLWNFGGRFLIRALVFSTAFVVIFPANGWMALPAVAYCVLMGHLSFKDWWGRILSATTIIAMLVLPNMHVMFKVGYILTAMAPGLVPDMSTDVGHTIGALMLDIFLGCMAVGANLHRLSGGSGRITKAG